VLAAVHEQLTDAMTLKGTMDRRDFGKVGARANDVKNVHLLPIGGKKVA